MTFIDCLQYFINYYSVIITCKKKDCKITFLLRYNGSNYDLPGLNMIQQHRFWKSEWECQECKKQTVTNDSS